MCLEELPILLFRFVLVARPAMKEDSLALLDIISIVLRPQNYSRRFVDFKIKKMHFDTLLLYPMLHFNVVFAFQIWC